MCTVESPIHVNIKKAIVSSDENDTQILLRRWHNSSRLFKNKVARDAIQIETEGSGEFSEIFPYVSGKRGREVYINGDVDHGVRLY